MRASIKALNAAHRVPDEPTRGYHETMTQAWMRLVHLTLLEYGPADTADLFFDQNPQLSEKKVLRLFYSRELMMSPRAKAEFVEPDLAPLPKSSGARPEAVSANSPGQTPRQTNTSIHGKTPPLSQAQGNTP
jgi:hypothetical protein